VNAVQNCTKDFGTDLFLMFCSPNATVFGDGPFNDTTGMVRLVKFVICLQYLVNVIAIQQDRHLQTNFSICIFKTFSKILVLLLQWPKYIGTILTF
jgi:hypothetical protein